MQGRKREADSGERERGEKEKNYKHKKFMEFYLVVLQSGYHPNITRSARHSVQQQRINAAKNTTKSSRVTESTHNKYQLL